VRLLAAAGALLAASPLPAQVPDGAPATPPIRASKIILIGDSTTAVIGGWGPSFCAGHVTSAVACLNLGRGGRSTLNYRVEGSWAIAQAEMRTPGYQHIWVLIQFGHNDQPGRPGRSTDLAAEFPANLRRYVQETRAAGAIPILLTPLTRRQFREGRLDNDLAPWAQAVRRVATELDVPLVDLNARSAEAVQAMGPLMAARFAQVAPPGPAVTAALEGTTIGSPPAPSMPSPSSSGDRPFGQARLSFDYTHLGREGADFFSALVTQELARAVPDMRPLLVP
jgi:lysophospholipase L1-like esterase